MPHLCPGGSWAVPCAAGAAPGPQEEPLCRPWARRFPRAPAMSPVASHTGRAKLPRKCWCISSARCTCCHGQEHNHSQSWQGTNPSEGAELGPVCRPALHPGDASTSSSGKCPTFPPGTHLLMKWRGLPPHTAPSSRVRKGFYLMLQHLRAASTWNLVIKVVICMPGISHFAPNKQAEMYHNPAQIKALCSLFPPPDCLEGMCFLGCAISPFQWHCHTTSLEMCCPREVSLRQRAHLRRKMQGLVTQIAALMRHMWFLDPQKRCQHHYQWNLKQELGSNFQENAAVYSLDYLFLLVFITLWKYVSFTESFIKLH